MKKRKYVVCEKCFKIGYVDKYDFTDVIHTTLCNFYKKDRWEINWYCEDCYAKVK